MYIELTDKNIKTWTKKFNKDKDKQKLLEVGHFIFVDESTKSYTLIHKESVDEHKALVAEYIKQVQESKMFN